MTIKDTREQLKAKIPDIVKRIRGGDSSAREEFASLLLPYIERLISKYKVKLDHNPASLAGLIITKLLSKLDKIDLEKNYTGFISTAAINMAIDAYRSSRKLRRKFLNNAVSIDSVPAEVSSSQPYGTPYSSVDPDSMRFFLEENFNTSDAEILSLYYIDNLDYNQISTVTGQSSKDIEETIALAGQFIRQD